MGKLLVNTIAGCLVLSCVFLACSTEDAPSMPTANEDYALTIGDIAVFVSETGNSSMRAELVSMDGVELGLVDFSRESRFLAWSLENGEVGEEQLSSEIPYEWFGQAAVTLWHIQVRGEQYKIPPDIGEGGYCQCSDYCCDCFRNFCLTHCAPCA